MGKSKVYFTKEITPENVLRLYNALGIELKGNVAVKVHSGEQGNRNFIRPEFFKPTVEAVKGTVVECNTAYGGSRGDTKSHRETMEKHGWTKNFKVDILDAEGESMELPVNGKHIKTDYVGANLKNYDSLLVLSHFKGHPMGGFGGAMKNISIGLASSYGKAVIHGAGEPEKIWSSDHDAFVETMADAAKAVCDYFKGKTAFVNVMCNMSVDCDCCSDAEDPKMGDIGILSSLDPLALDQACVDLVYAADDSGKSDLIERIESRNGKLILDAADKLGIGSREYILTEI